MPRLVCDQVLPNLRDRSGLVAFYVMDAADGTVVSLTLAENREAGERSNVEPAEWVDELFGDLLGSAEPLHGEIVIEHRFGKT